MVSNKFLELLDLLEDRPQLFLCMNEPVDYRLINSFLQGLFVGVDISLSLNIERMLAKWYSKNGKGNVSNMNWFAYFDQHNKHRSESDKINLLISILKEFLEDKTTQIEIIKHTPSSD